jgi:hypothetical protein
VIFFGKRRTEEHYSTLGAFLGFQIMSELQTRFSNSREEKEVRSKELRIAFGRIYIDFLDGMAYKAKATDSER